MNSAGKLIAFIAIAALAVWYFLMRGGSSIGSGTNAVRTSSASPTNTKTVPVNKMAATQPSTSGNPILSALGKAAGSAGASVGGKSLTDWLNSGKNGNDAGGNGMADPNYVQDVDQWLNDNSDDSTSSGDWASIDDVSGDSGYDAIDNTSWDNSYDSTDWGGESYDV
jgi:hypothetical protein